MSELDVRKLAERWVSQFHISDIEWKEVMVEQYMEYLHGTFKPASGRPEYIKPFLIVSNSQYRH